MKAIILAAGLGKRLGLEELPKPMYKINEKPILEHNILLLKKHDIQDICITLHYKGEVIKDYFEDGKKWNVRITYAFEKTLLGTSGGVKSAAWFLEKGSFFIIYGDNYTNIDLTEMLQFHKNTNPTATIALFDSAKSLNSKIAGGFVNLDKSNSVVSFIEGGKNESSGYVNAGVYILEPKVLDMIPVNKPSDFGADIFPKLLKNNFLVKGYLTNSFVLAIDTKDALELTKQATKQGEIKSDNN